MGEGEGEGGGGEGMFFTAKVHSLPTHSSFRNFNKRSSLISSFQQALFRVWIANEGGGGGRYANRQTRRSLVAAWFFYPPPPSSAILLPLLINSTIRVARIVQAAFCARLTSPIRKQPLVTPTIKDLQRLSLIKLVSQHTINYYLPVYIGLATK